MSEASQFKACVALEALKGIRTVNDIAGENDVAPTQVKKERREVKLERKVGQLVIEKEFLEKKCEEPGLDLSERP